MQHFGQKRLTNWSAKRPQIASLVKEAALHQISEFQSENTQGRATTKGQTCFGTVSHFPSHFFTYFQLFSRSVPPILDLLGPSRGEKGRLGLQNCKNWLSEVNFWLFGARDGSTRIARNARIAIIDFLGPRTGDSECLDCKNWLSKPNFCDNWVSKANYWVSGNPSNPRNPSRKFPDPKSEAYSSQIWGRQSEYPIICNIGLWKSIIAKTHFEQSESSEQSESTPNTRTNEFLSGLRGAKNFSVAFQIVFRIFFRFFKPFFFLCQIKTVRGQFRSASVPP